MVEIEDDGIGRNKAMEIKSQSLVQQKLTAIIVTEERLEIYNNTHGEKILIDVIDLKNENNEASGTKVKFEIPLTHS